MGRKKRELAKTSFSRVEALLFSRAVEWLLERRESSGDQKERALLSEIIGKMSKMREGFEARATEVLDRQEYPRRLRVSGHLRSRE